MTFIVIGLYDAKFVFHVYGITLDGEIVKKRLRCRKVQVYF